MVDSDPGLVQADVRYYSSFIYPSSGRLLTTRQKPNGVSRKRFAIDNVPVG